MKKVLMAVIMLASVLSASKASDPVTPMVLAGAYLVGKHATDEQHWSYRDGCKAKFSQSVNGPYGYDSYDHCQYLPRVYGGTEFSGVVKARSTLPTK